MKAQISSFFSRSAISAPSLPLVVSSSASILAQPVSVVMRPVSVSRPVTIAAQINDVTRSFDQNIEFRLESGKKAMKTGDFRAACEHFQWVLARKHDVLAAAVGLRWAIRKSSEAQT